MADEDDTAAAEAAAAAEPAAAEAAAAAAAPATAAAPKGARTMVIWTRPGHEIAMHTPVLVPAKRVKDLQAAGWARAASPEEAKFHGKNATDLNL